MGTLGSARLPLWKVWIVGGAAAIAIHQVAGPRIPHASEWLYFLVSLATVVAIVVGVRRNRPAHPWVWYLLAAGQAAFCIGDGFWMVMSILGRSIPYPSIADPVYLIAYPLFGAGLILAAAMRSGSSRVGVVLDAAVIMVGVSMISWLVLMRPYVDDPTAPWLSKAVSIAYPVGDLFLVGVLVPVIAMMTRRTTSARFLIAWLPLLLVADTVYAVMVIHNSYVEGSWVDVGWLASYVMLGAAALHPSMAGAATTAAEDIAPRPVGRLRIALLAIASVTGPVLILYGSLQRDLEDILVLSVGCVILAALVVVRLVRLVHEGNARRAELDRAVGQITHQALHDPLTGLANRTLFSDRLGHAAARARRNATGLTVLLLDLDDFKAINDGRGHAVGDQLLVEVARRLEATMRESDTVARIGGDEFAILIEDVAGEWAVRVAQRVLEAIAVPVEIAGREVFASASIGIAMHDPKKDAPSETLQHADIAMYRAKRAGTGRYVIFQSEMGESAVRRVELETDMRRAMDAGWADFRIHYQPVVDLDSGTILGLEALVRWDHPSRGLLPPNEFLSIAEETGLMLPLGRWILRESCATVARWRRSIPAMEQLSLSVNLSSKQVEAVALVSDVEEALGATGLEPSALTLELTEDVLVSDVDAVELGLRSLADLGVRLSVDDFGTGKSSMRYLARFPITELKIDKSYVDELASADGNPSLVQGMIDLGRAMRFRIVAEGIEHRRQAWSLRAMHCERGQGYLFARPQDAASTELVLRGQAVRALHPGGDHGMDALVVPEHPAVVPAA